MKYQIERANDMLRMREEGITYSEMARNYNLSVGRVRQIVEQRKRRILDEQKMREARKQLENVKTIDDFRNIPIKILKLKGGIKLRLVWYGITTVGDAIDKSDAELLHIEEFGGKSLSDLRSLIAKMRDDYGFPPEIIEWEKR